MAIGLDIDVEFMRTVYYLMLADGNVEDEELEKFSEIWKHNKNIAWRTEVREVCEGYLSNYSDQSDVIGAIKSGIDTCFENSQFDDVGKRNLVWTLVNVCYADSEFAESEREVVSYVAAKLELDESYLKEMEDSAKTLIALKTKRTWVENSGKPDSETKAVLEKIDNDQDTVLKSIVALVSIG